MKNKFLGIISILYSVIIIYTWSVGILKNFLAPNMQVYLKLSIIPLMIVGIILIVNKIDYKFRIVDLILLLPFILLILSGDGVLSLSIVENRPNNITRISKKKDSNIEEKKEEVKEEVYDFSEVYFDVIDENYNDIANYLVTFRNAEKYEGEKIRVRGFALTKASFIPKDMIMLGKYSITCCAADASFAGYFAKPKDKSIIENRGWYQIEGILRKGYDTDGFDIMYIDIINIEKIDSSKEDSYVYACYAYGDASCKEVTKYNFDYSR